MDTSETYIKMCETAAEIQQAWRRTAGDWFFLADEIKPHGKTRTYILGCHWSKCEGCKYEAETGVWVPRQDQLQDIIGGDNYILMKRFSQWALSPDRCKGRDWVMSSVEELWLAFVMREKYNKVWNGQDWVTTTQTEEHK